MNQNTQNQPGMTPEAQQAAFDALAAAILRVSEQQEKGSRPQNEPKTIDLVELFYHVLSKIVYVIIAAVVGAAVMGFTAAKSVPIYTATSKLYIVGNQSTTLMQNLQVGSLLTMDYQEVFNTWEVHEMVREQLNLNYSYSYLQSMLSVKIPEDTRVMYISIRNPDPQLATDLANAYAQAAKTFILQTMDTEEPNIFSVALVPSVAQRVSRTSRIMMGFMLGSVLAVGLIVLLFVMDERPRTPEDIARVADIPTLTVIPANKRKLLKRKGANYEIH